jgi:hypothetical protein
MQGNEAYTVFTLRVFYQDVKWTIDKRFSDCYNLSEELNQKYEGVPEFPARQPKFLHDPRFLQTRQAELQTYFQSFEQGAFSTDEMKNFLNAFTELHKLGYEIKPESPHVIPFDNNTSLYSVEKQLPTPSGFILPHRMMVIRLASGDLILYCPVLIDDALHYELLLLGKVRHIIIPNKLHFTYLPEYLLRFPECKVCVPPGIRDKMDILETALVLHNLNQDIYQGEVTQILTTGNSFFTEVLLYHKSAKALIVADFIINLPSALFYNVDNQTTPDASVYSLLATQLFPPSQEDDKPKCSEEHRKYCTDGKEFSKLMDSLLSLDFNFIVMYYGDIIDTSAKDILKSACISVMTEVSERWSVTNSLFSFIGSNK